MDRQTEKIFDTIYLCVWIFSIVEFATSLFTSIAGGLYFMMKRHVCLTVMNPVLNRSCSFRSMIEWSKDNRILSRGRKNVTRDKRHVGKAFVTAKGSLRIKKLSYADAGVYTCAGIISNLVKQTE